MQESKKKQGGISIPLVEAEKLRHWLVEKSLLESRLRPNRRAKEIVFPLSDALGAQEKRELKNRFPKTKATQAFFFVSPGKKSSLKEALKGILTEKEMQKLVSGFDTVGNIAIIEIPSELEKKEKKIARAVLETNLSIETVCKKTGAHKGRFRIEPVKIIAGKKNLVADYRESGARFRVHLGKTFFSPRLSFERLRIAKLIQPNETIGAFFAGVGPFPIVFAKNSPMQKAVAIELNPTSVKDLGYNIKLNKLDEKIVPVFGDVKKIVPKKFRGCFDRVVMPLPKGGEDFLKEALISIKPEGGIIHFYAFVPAENPFGAIEKRVLGVAQKNGFEARFLDQKQVRSFSKDLIQIVVDFWAKKRMP